MQLTLTADDFEGPALHPLKVEVRKIIDDWAPQRVVLSNVPARMDVLNVAEVVASQL